MKNAHRILLCALLAGAALPATGGCTRTAQTNRYDIVPAPLSITEAEGRFRLREGQAIAVVSGDGEEARIAREFAGRLESASGIALNVECPASPGDAAAIVVERAEGMGMEAYTLEIAPERITVRASAPAGFFYAFRTVRQLLPPAIESERRVRGAEWSLPCAKIEDEPRFEWRGMMLDVGRYFMPKDYVLKFIDRLAAHKINRFHFHLTEDQGWRIEIDGWPRLTEVAARRPGTMVGYKHHHAPVIYDSVPVEGYYTREDIREIVAYAAERYVTVVPEIELPGHASAAVAAYPEFSCGVADSYEVVREFGIFENVFCPNEKTFRFLEDVFAQVAELFPGPYIHIGGDECPKTAWKKCPHCQELIEKHGLEDENGLQSWFVRRVSGIIAAHGKRVIGWDEVLEGGSDGLAPDVTVMSWRGESGGLEAAAAGHDVIMVPNADTYLNYYQEDPEYARMGSGSFLTLERIYRYEPVPVSMPAGQHHHVLGTEATLWTPYMKTPDVVDYYMYPRFWAISEVAWSANRDYGSFLERLESQYARLDVQGVRGACRNYFDAYIDGRWNEAAGRYEVSLIKMLPRGEVRFTTNGSTPIPSSTLYTGPLVLTENTLIKAAVFDGKKMAGKITEKNFYISKATGKNYTANVPYRFKPDNPAAADLSRYNFSGLTNGIRGYVNHVHPWVAFRAAPETIITVDLEQPVEISRVMYGVLNGYGQEAVAPVRAAIEISVDNTAYIPVAEGEFDFVPENRWQIISHEFSFAPLEARYVRVRLENGTIPTGLGNYPVPEERQGGFGMVFMDEIEIH